MPLAVPISLALGRFKQLPQRTSEVWQGGLVRLPVWIDNPANPEGVPYRPTGAVWVSLRTGHVNLQLPPEGSSASADLALSGLFELAAKESKTIGGRPARIEVRGPALKDALATALAGTGTAVVTVDDLPAVRSVLQQFERLETGIHQPGLLETPGMTVERVRAFADGAARFYEARPWQHLVNEDLLMVEASKLPKGMACVSVLGNGGQQFGLAFFESRRAFDRMLDLADRRRVRRAHGVTFGPAEDLPFSDIDLWEDHALPLAGPRAYPAAADIRIDSIRRPDTRALTYMEALLRALADTTEEELDSGRWQRQVPTFDGPLLLTLSLPILLEEEQDPHRTSRRPPSGMRILAERGSAKVRRFLEQQEFASIDEVNRALETASQQGLGLFGKPSDATGSRLTALEQAQELAYDGLEATGRRRIKLARQALAVSPDCADAWILLGEAASTPEAALDWYQHGVEAGERAIGSACFAESVGQFWGLIGTRPYMRARLALAETLRTLGRIDEALDHYKELLRLNPDDNQGVRYLLLPALLEYGRDDDAGVLLANYEDDIQAIWPYGRALWLFRTQGDSADARSALQEARRTSPHVVRFLLDPEALPWADAPSFTLGSREEAAYAAGEFYDAFEKTSGALEWLGQRASDPSTRRKRR